MRLFRLTSKLRITLAVGALVGAPLAFAQGGHHHGKHHAAPTDARAVPLSLELETGSASPLSFRIKHNGTDVKTSDLALTHEKRLHVLIHDESLTQFFHIHPTEKDGVWTTDAIPFEFQGNYQVWVEGKTNEGAEFVLSQKLPVTTGKEPLKRPTALPLALEGKAGTSKVTLKGFENVRQGRDVMTTLEISRTDGSTPQLKPYLGALAHVVIVPLSGDELIHVHPMKGNTPTSLKLHGKFPKSGAYRMWVEFIDNDEHKIVPLSFQVR